MACPQGNPTGAACASAAATMWLLARCAAAVLAVVLAVTGPAFGTDLEQEAREIETMLIAPCCFRQQVSVHRSGAADEVRRDIRARLAAGETRGQILDAYVARYGRRILAQPPAEGFGGVLYVLPPLALILTGALVVMAVRRFTGARVPDAPAAASAAPPVEERYRERLEDELRDLD